MLNKSVIYDFSEVTKWNGPKMRELCNEILDKIFSRGNENKIVLVIDKCHDSGAIIAEDVFIYESYMDALPTINDLEYSRNYGVNIFEANRNKFAHMMYKTYDGYCYSRFARAYVREYTASHVRRFFDANAILYRFD